MPEDLAKALMELQEEEALSITKKRLASDEDPAQILTEARQGMTVVGEKFANGEYFIPDLIYSGEILKEITELVRPKLSQSNTAEKKIGKVVLGTVLGDIHDIGLNIVDFMLDTNGFEVINLGVDVSPEKFVEKVKETNAGIVGLSGFLTLAFDSMKNTVDALKAAGLREEVRIMIGGGQIDEDIRKYTNADAFGKDAMAAVALAKKFVNH